jgi:hypothetical protein
MHIEDMGTLAGNFMFMNLGEFKRTDITGRELGRFVSNEFALALAWGMKVTSDLSLGVNLKYIRSNLTPSFNNQAAAIGNSAALDIGLL